MKESRVLRATLEYDGTRYRGWQAQVNARTVGGAFAGAVREVLGDTVRIHGAGRTDAGVHAFAQVASIHPPRPAATAEIPRLRREVNDRLPADIHLLALAPAPATFHARHDAQLRIYRYRLSRRRTAFGKPFVFWVKDRLDADAMREAAAFLPGRHDFGSFCENPEGHDSTAVEVAWARVETPAAAPDLILFRIAASHYLWRMVRRVVGTLVEVGTGRLDPGRMGELLAARSAEPAKWTAPPSGLFLEAVLYDGDPPPPEIDPLRPAY
ncbi:MAG TPA: tRNA pseudouridine(38-40) synthase TruA [Thermoanaerobaculia bacterium]|nr:tRNA pseudouridine(38-40) synthase TruA [Thermoanaerobaculia bacterium]HQR68870.1 tRNA pseudouridine(38-40) synthase TruA [Thermoanaerobaculia bacterium]